MKRRRNRILAAICIMAVLFTSFRFTAPGNEVRADTAGNTVTLNPVADAYVRSGSYRTANFGSSGVLEVKEEENADNNRRAHLKFDLSSVAGTVERATLRLYAATVGFDLSRVIQLYGNPVNTWTETGINWDNAPSVTQSTHIADITVTNPTFGCSHGGVYRDHEHPEVSAQWYEIDVTEYVNGQLPDQLVSFLAVVSQKASGCNVSFGAREAVQEKRPQLVIETEGNGPGPVDPNAPSVYLPEEDTFIKGNDNTGHYHTLDRLEVRHNFDGNLIRRSYIKFNFTGFDRNIQRATLRLYANTIGATDTRTIEIGGVTNAWNAGAITWSGASGAPSAKNDSEFITNLVITNPSPGTQWTGGQWYEIDVTDYVMSRIDDERVSFVLWVRDTSPNGTASNNQVYFNSSEAAVGRPELILTPQMDRYECEELTAAVSNGVTRITAQDEASSGGRLDMVSLSQPGDYIEYALDIPEAGVYSVKINNKKDADRGSYRLSVDGTEQGQEVSQYGSTVSYAEEDLGLIVFQTAGVKAFRFVSSGKDPLSSGYTLGLDYIKLQKAQLERVANVTASPAAGLLQEPTEISLATATEDALIYYKIDDAAEWIPYTGPIHIDRTVTITAYAGKPPYMLDSDPAEFIYRFPVDTDIVIKPAASAILLDGSIETDSSGNPTGEWAGAELVKLEGTVDSAGRHGADVYLKYDYEMLYLGAKIKDPTPMVNTRTGSGIWNGDCLEIFIGDEDLDFSVYPADAMAPSDRQIVISGGKTLGYQYYLYTGGVTTYPVILMDIEPDADGRGYTLEAAIPLEVLGFTKPWQGTGRETILNVVLNDGAFAGRGQWGWTTDSEQTKKSRGLWGRAVFEAMPEPTDEITVTASVDSQTRLVTVTGRTLAVQNKYVAMVVRDPSGNIQAFDQVRSDGEGNFAFHYSLAPGEAGNGTYTVLIGGEDVSVAKQTTFEFTGSN